MIEPIEIINYQISAPGGIRFPCKSIIVQTETCVVISPGDFNEEHIALIKNRDCVPTFIAPNNFHNLYLKKAQENFPSSSFYGPARSAKVSGVDLTPLSEIKIKGLHPIAIKGHKMMNETCFYHEASRTMITTDVMFNMHQKMNLASKLLFTIQGTKNRLAVSRLVTTTADDRKIFFKSLQSLLEFPFETMIVGHGDNVSRSAFENFIRRKV